MERTGKALNRKEIPPFCERIPLIIEGVAFGAFQSTASVRIFPRVGQTANLQLCIMPPLQIFAYISTERRRTGKQRIGIHNRTDIKILVNSATVVVASCPVRTGRLLSPNKISDTMSVLQWAVKYKAFGHVDIFQTSPKAN